MQFLKYNTPLSNRLRVIYYQNCNPIFRTLGTEPKSSSHTTVPKYGGRYIVTMISGHGIGPELMQHVKDICGFISVPVDFEHVRVTSNNDIKSAIASAERNQVALYYNIDQGQGIQTDGSANIIFRKSLDIYLNIVNCKNIPGVMSKYKNIDILLFRQNSEGEYSLLEHENIKGVTESLKIITRKNTRQCAIRAFKFAIKKKRKRMTIIHKANIMKLSDGLFRKTIQDVGKDFPEIEVNDMIVDNCCMQMVKSPEQFDSMILPNLYGSILTNVLSGMLGGLAIFDSISIGERCAVFEAAIRTVGRPIAGKNLANPTAILRATTNLLNYLRLNTQASIIEKALDQTLYVDKIHTPDMGGSNTTTDIINRMKKHMVRIKSVE